ncbi:MAG: hypothetical protein IJ249_02520 [Paludibacteraceae bacterium]|nr:hypothetical protein [Paludibacteraceae bacterium]
MKTKSTVGRLITHTMRVAAMLLLLVAGTNAVMASDWVLNEDKYSATHYTDHLYLEVFLADLDGKNTFCQEGTLIATNGSKSIDLLTLKYINEGDDDKDNADVKAKLVMPNAKAWFTNGAYGVPELTGTEQTFLLKKWGSSKHYMTACIDLYYSSEMAGGNWKVYFHFKHSNDDWYDRVLKYSIGTSTNLGLTDYDWKSYKAELTGVDKLTFTVPQLPNDIDSKVSSVRMRKATYNVTYTFYKQDGSTMTVDKSYEASAQEKSEECSFPENAGNPARIDYKVSVTHGVKDPDNWFNVQTNTVTKENAFKLIPIPGTITTEYRQFNHQTVMTWTSPAGSNYWKVTPYIYRIETDVNGNKKSGSSLSKRGSLSATNGGAQSFTDDDATIGTYYQYMVANVPTDFIGKGVSESSLNSPSEALLAKLGCTTSAVVSTAPSVTIYGLRQDSTVKNKVRFTWQYTRVPVSDATVSFKVLRSTDNTSWAELPSVSGDANPGAGATLAFEDSNLPNSIVRYWYKVRLELAGGYRFESDAVSAGALENTTIKTFTATKGTHEGSVTLSWTASQVGTSNSTYVISRRYVNSNDAFMSINTTNGTDASYTFEDNTVKPGYYYEYSIQVFEGGVPRNTLYAVGFCQSRGTVSGLVKYGTGTAVPDVRLWLRASDTGDDNTVKSSSQYINGTSEGIAWKADSAELDKVFGNGKDYTVQFFVRPDAGLSEGAVLANIPGMKEQITLGKSEAGGYALELRRYNKTIDLSDLTGDYTAHDGEILTGYLYDNYKISIADGATVVLKDVTIEGTDEMQYSWAGLSCLGDATLILEGENYVQGFYNYYPGIHIPYGKTLTIQGTGSLEVKCSKTENGAGSGIGGGIIYSPKTMPLSYGNVVIEGGTINAIGGYAGIGGGLGAGSEYPCNGGNITITGGKVYAEGYGIFGTAIGPGLGVSGGEVTIANSVSSVTANMEEKCLFGESHASSCGPITIGGTIYWDGTNYQNGGNDILQQKSYTFTGDGSWVGTYTPTDYSYTITPIGATIPAGQYSLLTISKTGNQLNVQVDSGEVRTITFVPQELSVPFSLGGAQGITASRAFKGNFAEVRVWDHVLTEAEKASYFDRVLNGREKGLVLYWPLDEGLQKYAFDASYASDQPNGRHATMGNNIVSSPIVPAEAQLARYGVTNDKGEYLIRGIPFKGSGSGYTVVPEKGIHKFNPNTRSLFISPTSLTANNVDFEDESSFQMTGHIYYAGTNIPVEGIPLYVDGLAVSSNGKVQQTDADGYYSISVPIGEHYVEAKLNGHCLVDSGRFPIEGTYNFVDRVQYDFTDSTLVNFVGRVAGAKYNDTIAVGFGASKNNIGVAKLTLRLNNASFSFNCQNDYITPATTDRTFESDTSSIRSHAWTGSGEAANTKYIYITTDSATGEFSAKLPPLKYVMKSVEIINNKDNIEFTSLPEIDLTNPLTKLTDSICRVTEQGDTVYNSYTYNTKKVFTHYATPQVDVTEKGCPKGAFGRDSVIVSIDEEETDTLRHLYTVGEQESVQYLFGYPIYQMLDSTEYELHGYESYTNYDGTIGVTDTVHLSGQELTIGNEMSSRQAVIYKVPEDSTQYSVGDIYKKIHDKVVLDKDGHATLRWTVGAPNIASPFTRQFNITLKRDDRTYESFRMDAIVLGTLTTGNNFVTQGPDKVMFILRDPYGAHSKTTLKKGTVKTVSKYYTYQRSGEHSLIVDWLGGVDVVTANGFGVAIINSSNVMTDLTSGIKANWKYTHKQDTIFQTTTVESYSTGDKDPYVGARGDVFIGTATNILVGTCRKLHVRKDSSADKYTIVLEDALAMGEKVSTTFAYSQYELETVMIPKWKDQRKQFLTYVPTRQEAEDYVNNTGHTKYLTWLQPTDEHYGDSGYYAFKPDTATLRKIQQSTKKDIAEWDSVVMCNNQIKAWEKWMSYNEQQKIEAIRKGNFKNYSIDGGSSRTFTFRNDTTSLDQTQTDYSIQAVLGWKDSWEIKSVTSLGVRTSLQTSVGGGTVSGSGNDTTSYTEWEYVLADGNRDADLSINIYDAESGNNSKIFSLFAGQTYNPYEAADSTHYYKPEGKPLPLSNASEQMEQPFIQISKGNEAPAKSVTLTDIPAGQSATATLYCSNMSRVHQAFPFGYDVSVAENTDTTGLQILMDGTPINGRTIWTEQGTTVKKTITVSQTDQSILDHEGIEIYFLSQYQPKVIYDHVTLNAHFVPSSSPVSLTVTNPIVNTDPTTGNGQLQLKVSGFDRTFKNLKNVGIQYRFAGSTQWTTLHTWVTNKADSTDKSYNTLPSTGDLRLTLDMSNNISYKEGDYEFRAFTTTPYGHENVYAYSDVTKVIKDMTKPRPLYTPAPANGILGIGENLAVEFNEDIVPGYVGDKNVIVTAKLNGRPIDHEVSYHIHPFGTEPKTINPVFLSGDFSLEFWLNWQEEGTVLHHGVGGNSFALSIDEAGHVVVRIAGTQFTSREVLPKDKWTFFAMNYKASTMTFNMLAQYDETTAYLFRGEKVSEADIQVADYAMDNYLYLGPVNANIHNLALYNTYRDVMDAASKKYESKDTYTYGLTNYWPMNEGHGAIAADTRHTHDFEVPASWDILNTNYALRIDSTAGAQFDISRINTGMNDSYAVEMWYLPSSISRDTVFETQGLCLRYDSLHNLVLDYGKKSQTVAAYTDSSEVRTGWHHMALNVVRGQAASFYLDGQRTAVIAEADVPVLKGASFAVAKGNSLSFVDEIRIWNATLSEHRLLGNMYNTIDTADFYSGGLMAYYPFEKDSTINGVKTKGFTMQNMAPRSDAGEMTAARSMYVNGMAAPPLKNAPSETRITALPVASERKVVINLSEAEVSLRDIEGTTLNITMSEVHDLNGNMSNPIKWTAYVQQNTLKWAKDSVNIFKKYGEDYTFDVTIENKGGQIEYYTVENMPKEWLSLVDGQMSNVQSQMSNVFDVQPLKTKTLRFAVSPLVPVNNYDVTIGLKGNNGIIEPLRIVMKVSGNTPEWTVNPALYDHSMTIIGQVYLGGILMENPESMVAAFIGSECRGVATPQKIRGAAYETLIIYGSDTPDADRNAPLTFRIWDATRGIAYTDANIQLPNVPMVNDQMVNEVIFRQDTMIGNFDTPAIWTKSDRVEQLIPVHENWNWITFGVEPPSEYCDLVFTPQYKGWNVLVKDENTFSQSSGSIFNGPLKLAVNIMYKLRIQRTPKTTDAVLDPLLSVSGRQPAPEEIPVSLRTGWNWLPYTPLTTKRASVALAGAQPKKGDMIKSQTAVSIYGTYGWEGTLLALEPGHGYLYFSTDSTAKSFVYPADLYQPHGFLAAPAWSELSQTRSAQTTSNKRLAAQAYSAYPSNMTMTIRLMDGEAVVDTCEIAAFIGGECRGAVRAHTDSLYYLVIAGDGAGQPMELRTVINGEEIVIDKTLTFVSDNHLGTPWEPYVIQLNPAEGVEEIEESATLGGYRKILINGILYIIRPDGEKYDATGKRVSEK